MLVDSSIIPKQSLAVQPQHQSIGAWDISLLDLLSKAFQGYPATRPTLDELYRRTLLELHVGMMVVTLPEWPEHVGLVTCFIFFRSFGQFFVLEAFTDQSSAQWRFPCPVKIGTISKRTSKVLQPSYLIYLEGVFLELSKVGVSINRGAPQ